MDVLSPKNRVDDSSQIQSERLKKLKMDGPAIKLGRYELALNVTSFFRNSSILKSEAGFHDRSRAKLDTSILSKYMSTPPAGPEIIKIIS